MRAYRRPCQWYAQAPLGPFSSRTYRLIEFSFACVFCPITADAVKNALQAPSDEEVGFLRSKKTGGEKISLLVSLPPYSPCGESTSLITSARRRCASEQPPVGRLLASRRGRLSAAAGLGITNAFWNPQPCWGFSYTIKRRIPLESSVLLCLVYSTVSVTGLE